MYVNVKVSSDNAETVTACRGYLLKIEKVAGGRSVQNIFQRKMQCIWEFDEAKDGVDLSDGTPQSFNVVMYQDGQRAFSPRIRSSAGTAITLTPYLHVFDQYGEFEFSGVATAENARPGSFAVRVAWDGNWPPRVTPI